MNKRTKLILLGIVAVLVIIVGASSFTVVESGHTGVLITMGAVSDNMLAEGVHVVAPFFQNVIQIDNRTHKVEISGSAASKDLQTVTCDVAVNFRVLNASSASLYKNVGIDYESIIIAPAVQESIKAITAQYTAEQLITKRAEVGDQIKASLQAKITPYGLNIEIFNIVNFNFSEEFNSAVEAKQTAEQQALKAQQDLARIEIEAQQKIAQAQAEAESIKMIQETLAMAPEYIEYIKWSKWDGKLPTFMGDTSDIMIDAGSLVDNTTTPATP
jgi:regulator of protease activity HflC (stomatin/prohibitin superfamily)